MENRNIKSEIEKLLSLGFSQSETVFYLKENGFDEKEIKKEIFTVYPKLTKENVRKSWMFIFSLIVISLLSLSPILGLYLHGDIGYLIFSIILLTISFGYYQLNIICIWLWLILVGLLVFYFIGSFFWKISGNSINILYSYTFIFSCILFSSTLLLVMIRVYAENKKVSQQYVFEED